MGALSKVDTRGWSQLLDLISVESVACTIVILFLSCLYTRVQCGLRKRGPNEVKRIPHWIPFLGHGMSVAMKRESFIAENR